MPRPRMPLSRDARLLEYLSLLRYGTTDRFHQRKPLLNCTSIAKIVQLKPSTVQYLIKVYQRPALQVAPLFNRRLLRLRKHHIEFLTSEDTLRAWAHLSLKQRAKLAHRQFPEVKFSSSSLQRLYKKHGIRFKFIQKIKKEIDFHDEVYRELFTKMVQQLQEVKDADLPLIFLDEAIFSFNTFKTKAWSKAYKNIVIKDHAIKVKTQALIAAISLEDGFVDYLLHPKSIKTEEFKVFLKQLSNRFDSKPFAIFLDNLSVHKTNLSKECFQELQITPIFNIPYSPQFNGIESYFSILKNEYKNLLLQQIIKGEKVDAVRFIKMAIEAIDEQKTKRCVKYGLDCIKQQQEDLRK
ncbi:hypothetical protein FGO68_gene16122 [Halteria grandinella]|uniref:Tc1-like transposase DDE domain-containing protein n=1 Tax=Halteria grandinella TaxID=5974 RepID=A0A8J8SXN1_HALGN|nr:hypothetical protein FGO68_gene16122 [Halteria grandinella]